MMHLTKNLCVNVLSFLGYYGNDIDVYLRPLIEELLLLWQDKGVHVWDEDKQENFNL